MSRNSSSLSLYIVSVCAVFLTIFSTSYHVAALTNTSPTAPTNVKAATYTSSSPHVVISWNQALDNIGVTRYNIYKNGTFMVSPPGVGVTYTDYNVAVGQLYTYAIQAGDGDGNNSPQSDTIAITVSEGAVAQITPPPQTVDSSTVPIAIPQATVYSNVSYSDEAVTVTPPDTVGLSSLGKELHVTWGNSKNNQWKSIRVIKKINSYPAGPTDGTIICDSLKGECIDKEVIQKTTYYYGVYAVDQSFITSRMVLLSGALVGEVRAVISPPVVTQAAKEVTPVATRGATRTVFFIKTLKLGSTGDDVLLLQKFLNTHGFIVTTSGPGSKGNETSLFGLATEKALKMYQCSEKIVCDGTPTSTGYGTVGKTTRGYLNKKE